MGGDKGGVLIVIIVIVLIVTIHTATTSQIFLLVMIGVVDDIVRDLIEVLNEIRGSEKELRTVR